MQWDRISRWLYRSPVHDITWRSGVWRVTRRAHVHIEVGTSSHLEIAKIMAEDDAELQELRKTGAIRLPLGYLTTGHGRGTMVSEDNKPERTTSNMAESQKCQCLDRFEEVKQPDGIKVKLYSGCGQTVARKRQFVPGHDAKLKSTLIKAFRAGEDIAFLRGGVTVYATPADLAKERGWTHFLTPAPAKKVKAKDTSDEAPESIDPHEVFAGDRGELDPETLQPMGYQPALVKYRNKWRDGNIVEQTLTEVTVEFDNKGTAKQITLPLDSDKLELG